MYNSSTEYTECTNNVRNVKPQMPKYKKPLDMELDILKVILKTRNNIDTGRMEKVEAERVKSGYYLDLHHINNIIMEHELDKSNPYNFRKNSNDGYITSQLTTEDINTYREYVHKNSMNDGYQVDISKVLQGLEDNDMLKRDEMLDLNCSEEQEENDYAYTLSPITVKSDA